MVTLVKKRFSDISVLVAITDGSYVDELSGKMDNYDIMRIIGKALSLGYSDFVLTTGKHGVVAEYDAKGSIKVNWKVVRILGLSEWKERDAQSA